MARRDVRQWTVFCIARRAIGEVTDRDQREAHVIMVLGLPDADQKNSTNETQGSGA